MTDEEFAARKKFAGEKKASMKRRDLHHDYTERRMYMITLETEGRKPLFGHLEGNPYAERGSNDAPHIVLSPLGQAVQNEWMGIHRYFPQIEVKAVQMMPDHMHGILFVTAPLPVHLGQVISGFKAGCRKAQRVLVAAEQRTAAEPLYTKKAASQYITAAPLSKPLSNVGTSLFAKGYNDLILRTYDELLAWQKYLQDNPRRLMMKRARPEWLRPFFNLTIGDQCYNGIGNRELLTAPLRMSVRVSRRVVGSDLDREVQRYLDAAKNGAVLVSPAISPGEKRVMREAFNAGLPTIVLLENGFTPLSKPHGEQFDACAQGRLLMLSPWEHHNEKRTITAMQCQQLNIMALKLCE